MIVSDNKRNYPKILESKYLVLENEAVIAEFDSIKKAKDYTKTMVVNFKTTSIRIFKISTTSTFICAYKVDSSFI